MYVPGTKGSIKRRLYLESQIVVRQDAYAWNQTWILCQSSKHSYSLQTINEEALRVKMTSMPLERLEAIKNELEKEIS